MKRRAISLPLMLYALPALAQQAPAPQEQKDQPSAKDDIVVVAERLRGRVDTPLSPVATFDEAEIQAMGVGSVSELLSRVSPQTGSGRGRGEGGMPIVLVNGQRITNFREMRNYPPESIKKVEILPEEVALKFGFPPDTRVVNLILKDKFRSIAVEGGYSLPTLGGFSNWSLESTLTRIGGPSRLSLTASTSDTSPLFEAERGVIQQVPPAPGAPDPAEFRTLIADSRSVGANLAWTRGLGKGGMAGQITLSGAANRADSRRLQGLDSVLLAGGTIEPIEQRNRTTTLQGGAGLNKSLGNWQLSATIDATHGENRTLTDRRGDPSGATDRAQSTTNRIENLVTLIGRPLRLPAGQVSATIKAGYTWVGLDSSNDINPLGPVSLKRGRLLGGINLGLPLTSRREGFLGEIGDVTLNLSADWTHLSDFGAVNSWSTGLTWAPTGKLSLQASYISNQSAPAISQLGNPLTQIFNVAVYDFTRGETALVTLTSGGNPLLRKESQRDLKLGVNWQLPFLSNSNVVAEYFRNRSSDVTASFPLLTPEIEAAFPGRVTRGVGGQLIAIDQRPVTFFRQESARLRWGVNLSQGFGKAPPAGGMMGAMFGGRGGGTGQRPPGGPPPGSQPQRAGGGGRGGGMMAMMGGGGQPGRWSLGLFHTAELESRVLVTPGGPVLDLLDGDALSGGGTPRHSVEFNGGVFYKGMGSFVSGTWKAPTTLAASGLPGTSDLRFGSTANINLFLFVDLGMQPKLVEKAKFLKGSRLSLRIENLLGSRQRVTDETGTVPLSYQPDYLDPRGRVIGLNFRKMF